MNDITLCMTAWARYPERLEYLNDAIVALQLRLRPWPVRWLVSAESENCTPGGKEALRLLCGHRKVELTWHEGPPDLGANLNHMLRQIQTPYLLYVQDDWTLHSPLDVTVDRGLLEDRMADFVQYYWYPDKPEAVGMRLGIGNEIYHRIRPEHQTWYYRDNPYLARRDVFDRLGPFPEQSGASGQHAEFYYAQHARSAGISVFGRGENPHQFNRYFHHIGGDVSAIHGIR